MPVMVEVQGSCLERFGKVKELLQGFLATGEEYGACITVNINGENVVDLWGGFANPEQPWQQDTITAVFSCTKTVTALAALLLIDRNLLDVDSNVSKYWPEFAANGKQDIKVRHILSHTSGVPGWDDPVSLEDICDTDTAAAKLSQQAPWWQPGTASGYQSFTMGHLIGELVRRVTGGSLGQFILDELTTPLGADFRLGVASEDTHRVADLIPPPQSRGGLPDKESVAFKVFTNPAFRVQMANEDVWRNSKLGAASGFGHSRSLVRILSVVTLGGTVDGVRFLSPDTIDQIFWEQANGVDLVTGDNLRFGIGFGLTGPDTKVNWLPSGRVCFWGGFGGSMIIMDLDRRMTIGYVMNRMETVGLGTARTRAYIKAVYAALDS